MPHLAISAHGEDRAVGPDTDERDCAAAAISVDPQGRPWAVGPNGQVWQAANK